MRKLIILLILIALLCVAYWYAVEKNIIASGDRDMVRTVVDKQDDLTSIEWHGRERLSEWRVFDVDPYFFSVQYPAGWIPKKDSAYRNKDVLHQWSVAESGGEGIVFVSIYANEDLLDIHAWWDERIKTSSPIIEDLVSDTVGGKEALMTIISEHDSSVRCSYAAHRSYTYSVCHDIYAIDDVRRDQYKDVYEGIRLGIRFLEKASDADRIAKDITGRWRSVDDENSLRVFDVDGSMQDIYADEPLAIGTWMVREKDDRLEIVIEIEEDETILTVVDLTKERLIVNNSTRGNDLTYNRILE